jgi:hypothetical protein
MPNNTIITIDQLRIVLLATEDGNDPSKLNTFRYAEAKSSYSFGLLQFDVDKNSAARNFLLNNGFSQKEISQLREHGTLNKEDLKPLNAKLQAIPQDKIDAFIQSYLQNSIAKIDNLIDILRKTNPVAAQIIADSQDLQLSIADYDNQYHMNGKDPVVDPHGPLVRYLSGERVFFHSGNGSMQLAPGKIVTANDIWEFIERSKYNVSWANDPKNKKPHAPLNRPSVVSREQRLQGALNQLDRPSWLPSASNSLTRFGAPGHHFDSSNGISPPVWSKPNDLGISPPSVGSDDTHEDLF